MIYKFVIQNYAHKYRVSLEESISLHKRLETYLDKVSESKTPISPSKEIDEVWHNFILHTKLYASFCYTKYGKFIHHNPQISGLAHASKLSRYKILILKMVINKINLVLTLRN